MIRLSLVIPLFRPPRRYLELLLDSIDAQRRDDCEVILVADGSLGSDESWVRSRLVPEWITLHIPRPDGPSAGISVTCNEGVKFARGSYVGFVDQDDLLESGCLNSYCDNIAAHPNSGVLYCDERTIDADGEVQSVFRKPDWNAPRLECQNYICHLLTVRRELFNELDGFRAEFDYAQDWDLCLRAADHGAQFTHIRRVLYSWRAHGGSTAGSITNKSGVREVQRKVLEQHVLRSGAPGTVVDATPSPHFWISRRSDEPVSIVIPSRASPIRARDGIPEWFPSMAEICVRSIHETLDGLQYETIVVLDDTAPDAAPDRLTELGCRIVDFDEEFNFAKKCNIGAAAAKNELVVFLNDDIVCQTPGWTAEMAAVATRPDVGAVGARLLFPTGVTQHAGHTFVGSGVTHACYGQTGPSFNARDLVDSETVGVTAACLMTRRSVFEEIGGFSEDFPAAFNDVDMCQKIRVAGFRCISLGRVSHIHFESQTREPDTKENEIRMLFQRWGSLLLDDPFRSSGDGFDMDFERRERIPNDYASTVLARIRSFLNRF